MTASPDRFEQIKLQQNAALIKEMQRLIAALSGQGTEQKTTQNKAGSTNSRQQSRMESGERNVNQVPRIPDPMPVVITDSTGSDKKRFFKLLEHLGTLATVTETSNQKTEKSTENTNKSLEYIRNLQDKLFDLQRDSKDQSLRDKRDSEDRDRDDKIFRDEQKKSRETFQDKLLEHETRKESAEEGLKDFQRTMWDRSYSQRVRDNRDSGKMFIRTRAVFGSITDKFKKKIDKSNIATSVASFLGKEGVGEAGRKDLERRKTLQEKIDTMKKVSKIEPEEMKSEFEKSHLKDREDRSRRQEREDEDRYRSRKRTEEDIERVKANLGGTTYKDDSYTEAEEERVERGSMGILTTIQSETSLSNKIMDNLRDPRGKSLNVRIMEVKGGVKLGGGITKDDKKDGGGLFSSLFSGIKTAIVGGLSAIGAGLGGGAIAGGIGLAGATAALGASLWTLKEAWDTHTNQVEADRNAIELHQHSSKNAAAALNIDAKELGTTVDILRTSNEAGMEATEDFLASKGKSLSSKILKRKAELAGEEIKKLDFEERKLLSKQKRYDEASWYEKTLLIGSKRGLSDEEDTRLKQISESRKKFTGSQVAFELEAKKRTNQVVVVENQRRLATTGGTDPVVSEVEKLRLSMEKMFGVNLADRNADNNRNAANRLAFDAAAGSLVLPDAEISQPPHAKEQMGTITS